MYKKNEKKTVNAILYHSCNTEKGNTINVKIFYYTFY